MKFLPLAILIGCLLACNHQQPTPQVPERADNYDCQNVYTYILTLTVDKLDENHSYSKRQREALAWEVEQEYERKGSKDRFLAVCQRTMTKAQVDCMLHVNDIEDMHTCATLVK